MGNDQSIFPSKPPYGVWEMVDDEQVLAIYRDSTYDGKPHLRWRGTVNEHTQELVESWIGLIPNRPQKVLSLRTRVANLLGEFVVDADNVFDDDLGDLTGQYADLILRELGKDA